MRVDVYANIRDDCISIRSREPDSYGTVVDYADSVAIEDARFVIQNAGQEDSRRQGKKTVHAYVRGKKIDKDFTRPRRGRKVIYNPFEYDYFVDAKTEEPVHVADEVVVFRDAIFIQ